MTGANQPGDKVGSNVAAATDDYNFHDSPVSGMGKNSRLIAAICWSQSIHRIPKPLVGATFTAS